jgi:chemotaxis protein methyltransferase CheR
MLKKYLTTGNSNPWKFTSPMLSGKAELSMKLTVEAFMKLRNIIYDKTGLFYESKKIYFVKKRLEKRMKELNITDTGDYYNFLKFGDKNGTEMQRLINLMTTNETYFFREENQLSAFVEQCLPEVLNSKRKSIAPRIKIWSAGCSTGEEAYTLAILLKEKLPKVNSWTIEILATDIDTDVLDKARAAVYGERSVRYVSPPLMKKYFLTHDNSYLLKDEIKCMVRFAHLNLFNSLKMRTIRAMDFIFCRNVLIYFDDASRKAVVANFYDSLNPGGYIYLGHSESVNRISSAFNIKRAGGLVLHQKPSQKEVREQ